MKNIVIAILLLTSCQAKSQENFIKVASKNSVSQTVEKLTNALTSKGLTVFDVIDHQKGAQNVAIELNPTTVVIFGNPKMGSKLMNCDQTIGLDLPMKMLVWQDNKGSVWLGYTSPKVLAQKYELDPCKDLLVKMEGAMHNFAQVATN